MSELSELPRCNGTQASEITVAWRGFLVAPSACMKPLFPSRGRLLLLFAVLSLGGCSDDDCGTSSLQLEVTPSQACLQLSATAGASSGSYQIVGTNNCADALVVHYPGTHDGGANETFPAGAQISIPLNDSEVINQDAAVKTWARNAVLGSETIMITMTKTPC